jgi:RimJ/RimL family protein N-acetyltransferase
MFARTERLLLRPGWTEDAPALAAAIGSDSVLQDLCWGRWPSVSYQAEAWLRLSRDPLLPSLLVLSRTSAAPEIVGGTGLHRAADGTAELDFWISPRHRCRGFATEAARAMLAIAQTLRLRRLAACVLNENGAAGRVLEKLGFQPTATMTRQSAARTAPAQATRYSRVIDGTPPAPVPLLAA